MTNLLQIYLVNLLKINYLKVSKDKDAFSVIANTTTYHPCFSNLEQSNANISAPDTPYCIAVKGYRANDVPCQR